MRKLSKGEISFQFCDWQPIFPFFKFNSHLGNEVIFFTASM